jgi:cytochrome oxidase Cu insertion factor (SCO1/SenC/PrrC family)
MADRAPKKWMPYVILAAAIFFTAVTASTLWILGNRAAQPENHSTTQGEAQIGGPFSLVDQNGERRSEADFRGRYMLVFFGFTNCPDVCPTTLAMISEAFNKLGAKADQIVPIFISIDPERDTPEILKSYLASFGPRFVGLTGTAAEVANVAQVYRVYYQKAPLEGGGYTMNHSSIIYLMDKRGKFVAHYEIENGPDALAADLAKRL